MCNRIVKNYNTDFKVPMLLALGVLGEIRLTQSRFEEAEALFRRAHVVCVKVHGDEHEMTMGLVQSLGVAARGLSKWEESVSLFEKALPTLRKSLGAENPLVVNTTHDLGHSYMMTGSHKYKEAEEWFSRALPLMEKVHGPDHELTMVGVGNIGRLHYLMGDHDKAESYLRRAYAARARLPEARIQLVRGWAFSLGSILLNRGREEDFEEAEDFCDTAIEILERTNVTEPSVLVPSLHSLAIAAKNRGKFDKSAGAYRRAVDILEKTKGPDDTELLIMLHDAATVVEQLGTPESLSEATEMYLRAVDGCEKQLEPNNASMLLLTHNAGVNLVKRGKYEDGEKYLRRVFETRERELGIEAELTLASLHKLADAAYYQDGKEKEAEALYRRAMEAGEKAFGNENPQTLAFAHSLACCLRTLYVLDEDKQPNGVEELFDQTLERRKKVLGENHMLTLSTLMSRANLYTGQGRMEEAERDLRHVVEHHAEEYGLDNAETRKAAGYLAQHYRVCENDEEADKVLARFGMQ